MNDEEIKLIKKLKDNPAFDKEDIKRLQKAFEEDDVKKSLKQIMKRYKYTIDELKEILGELEESDG